MFQTKAKLIKNIEVIKNYYKIILSCPQIAKVTQPGQFLQVKVSDNDEPLLRRPFSIHRVSHKSPLDYARGKQVTSHKFKVCDLRDLATRGQIEILYEVVGAGTEILSRRKPGEYLDILGPLGNGFSYPLSAIGYRLSILVAGGMGVAPLMFLAERMISHKSPLDYARGKQVTSHKIMVLIGARRRDQILCAEGFKRLGCDVKIATDDGSRGFKGKVSDLLKKILLTNLRTYELTSSIYACGPRPMLKEISRISKQYHIPAQISLEEHMACGIGACLGCVVKVTKSQSHKVTSNFEYKRVCKEGPIFNADEIVWE